MNDKTPLFVILKWTVCTESVHTDSMHGRMHGQYAHTYTEVERQRAELFILSFAFA